MDQLIADAIGKETPLRSLELTTEGLFLNQIGCSYISYDKNGDPIPRESDPQLLFDRLFRNPLSDPRKRGEVTSLLDRVSEDARSLHKRSEAHLLNRAHATSPWPPVVGNRRLLQHLPVRSHQDGAQFRVRPSSIAIALHHIDDKFSWLR